MDVKMHKNAEQPMKQGHFIYLGQTHKAVILNIKINLCHPQLLVKINNLFFVKLTCRQITYKTCSSRIFPYRGLSIAYSNATNVIAGVAFLIPMGFTNGAPTF